MQRIEVTGEGITVTLVTEPLVSMYGKEMRPGATSVYALPWDEISGVSLSVTELAPDGERWVDLTVDVTWGEYFEVHQDAEGFADAVREVCRLSGLPVPDTAVLTTAAQVIWPGPGPA
ncbi:hypothetical protein GCM10022251_34170 [Phytohabitans flavus]|uniref:Uncharacterized protein n=1 Tax=Phytohabitans flavus TaxID=1076124 RepID=A0A6F8XN32_9ACTN|nr:hypothetical protein [Phytohabitans flavus]BCB75226.1 hypothetical protein Pflav_016360 [Phytohabitans flavus]